MPVIKRDDTSLDSPLLPTPKASGEPGQHGVRPSLVSCYSSLRTREALAAILSALGGTLEEPG